MVKQRFRFSTYPALLIWQLHLRVLLSLRLTGVEALEWVSQKFRSRFHFLNLVSEIYQNTSFNYWY